MSSESSKLLPDEQTSTPKLFNFLVEYGEHRRKLSVSNMTATSMRQGCLELYIDVLHDSTSYDIRHYDTDLGEFIDLIDPEEINSKRLQIIPRTSSGTVKKRVPTTTFSNQLRLAIQKEGLWTEETYMNDLTPRKMAHIKASVLHLRPNLSDSILRQEISKKLQMKRTKARKKKLDLGKTVSSEQLPAKQTGKTVNSEQSTAKQTGKTVSSEQSTAKQTGKTVSSEQPAAKRTVELDDFDWLGMAKGEQTPKKKKKKKRSKEKKHRTEEKIHRTENSTKKKAVTITQSEKAVTSPQPAEKALTSPQSAEKALTIPQPAEKALTSPQPAEKALTSPQSAEKALTIPQPAEKALTIPQPAATALIIPQPEKALIISQPETQASTTTNSWKLATHSTPTTLYSVAVYGRDGEGHVASGLEFVDNVGDRLVRVINSYTEMTKTKRKWPSIKANTVFDPVKMGLHVKRLRGQEVPEGYFCYAKYTGEIKDFRGLFYEATICQGQGSRVVVKFTEDGVIQDTAITDIWLNN